MANFKELREWLESDEEEAYDCVAQQIADEYCTQPVVLEEGIGRAAMPKLVQGLLGKGMFLEVATLCWSQMQFSAEPRSCRLIWEAMPEISELIIIGAGSLGKSFTPAAWLLLDWCRDPLQTTVKVVSSKQEHAKKNIFANIKRLHQESLIPLPGTRKAESIMASDDDSQGIHLVAIPGGDEGFGKFQGFHPKPRSKAHKYFGNLTRIRAALDEAEDIAGGVWAGVDNMTITKHNVEHVKIIASTNPRDKTSQCLQRAEPVGGWKTLDIENAERWKSKEGWDVIRLDGARCENVIQKKVIYQGLISWEGYKKYLSRGTNDPNYFTMARGWPPESGANFNIVPGDVLDDAIGTLVFTGPTVYVLSADLAFEGEDLAPITIGKYGKASGWIDSQGLPHEYKEPRFAMEAMNQFEIQKGRTEQMTDSIISVAKNLGVKPEWVIVDRMQPKSEPVLTPDGWKKMGEIKVGDYVIGSNGKKTKVLGVSSRLDKTVLKIEFSDKTFTRCGPDHLWTIKISDRKDKTLRTDQIKLMMESVKPKESICIPTLTSPVQYNNYTELPIDPYLLGFLLGDGNIRENGGIRFSTNDLESLEEIKKVIPSELTVQWSSKYDYTITNKNNKKSKDKQGKYIKCNSLLKSLKDLGLSGKKSHNKFIPDIYIMASPEDRLNLLRGIMDSDGYVNKKLNAKTCSIGITLNNEMLIKQVIELVHSLGGVGNYVLRKKAHKEIILGRECEVRDSFRAAFRIPEGIIPFTLKRKVDLFDPYPKKKLNRKIVKITEDQDEESMCIKVEAKDGLYLTRSFIVTHNTGNGTGVDDLLKAKFGPECTGIHYGEGATNLKIMDEDSRIASDIYASIATELWFGMRRWMEFGYLKINPSMPLAKLRPELTGRQFKQHGGGEKVRVESKGEYKKRGNKSPDWADSLCLALHKCRMNRENSTAMLEGGVRHREIEMSTVVDKLQYVTFD